MTLEEIAAKASLDPARHYELQVRHAPVLDSQLYTSLGKRLFDVYEKYSIEPADQREVEALSYFLVSFTVHRNAPRPSLWQRLKNLF